LENKELFLKHNILVLLLISVIGLFYILTIREGQGWGGDFSIYIHHAKNICEGMPYNEIGYIYNPSDFSSVPKTYPPIFPLFLAIVYKVFGLNFTAMKAEIVIFFLCSLFIIFLAFKNELTFGYILLFIAFLGFNPFFWNFKDNILSDIPFLFFIYLSILIVNKAYSLDYPRRNQAKYIILLGMLFYFSYGIRNAGIMLIPAFFIYDWTKAKKLTFFPLKVTLVFLLFSILEKYLLRNYDLSYFSQLKLLTFQTISANFKYYLVLFPSFITLNYVQIKHIFLFIVTNSMVILGYFYRIKNGIKFSEIFFLFYLILIFLWPIQQGMRFLIPLLPLYTFYMLFGVKKLYLVGKYFQKAVLAILMISIFAIYTDIYADIFTRLKGGPITEGVNKKETVELFRYIRDKTKKDDIFIFAKPMVLSLFTGRKASTCHWTDSYRDIFDYFRKINATYIVMSFFDDDYIDSFIGRNRNSFSKAYSNSDFIVYRIILENK